MNEVIELFILEIWEYLVFFVFLTCIIRSTMQELRCTSRSRRRTPRPTCQHELESQ